MCEINNIDQLKKAKLQNDLILKFVGEGIFGLDNNGVITFVNPAATAMLGYRADELIGKNQHNIIHHTQIDGSVYPVENCTIYKAFRESVTIKKSDEIFWRKDGTYFYVEFTSSPIIEKGETKGAVVIFRDITVNIEADKKNRLEIEKIIRKEVVKQTEEDYNNFKLSLLNAPAVICIFKGPEHIYEFVNNELIKTIGKREYIGKTVREALPEIAGQGFYEILDEVYLTGKPFIGNEVHSTMKREGSDTLVDIYWNFIYQPIFDENNKVIGINDFSWDVTDQVIARKKLEALAEELDAKVQERTAELKEANLSVELERQKLNDLFMNAPAGICLLSGKEHTFIFANPTYMNLVGNRNLKGKTLREAFPDLEGQGIYEIIDNVYNKAEPINLKELSADLDNDNTGVLKRFYFNIFYHPVYNTKNEVEGISVFVFDITEQVNARKKIEEVAKALELSNNELNSFAYAASHDLKAPIRTIASYAELLQRRYNNQLDEQANNFINSIVLSSTRIKNLIDDLLEHAKISNEDNSKKDTNLNNVVSIIINELRPFMEENNAVVNYNKLPVLKVNQHNMIRLFQNLIVNSIKYRSDKDPVINITAKKEDAHWLFSVKDNGIGIDSKYSAKIFDIFQRLDTNYDGTGIGLAICKKIVELNNGKIWVESEEGKGATFFFTLPINN